MVLVQQDECPDDRDVDQGYEYGGGAYVLRPAGQVVELGADAVDHRLDRGVEQLDDQDEQERADHQRALPTPEAAMARVRQRVLEGGHDVPAVVIRRRFHAGWRNFESVYRDVVDYWALYDSTGEVPVLLAEEGER